MTTRDDPRLEPGAPVLLLVRLMAAVSAVVHHGFVLLAIVPRFLTSRDGRP